MLSQYHYENDKAMGVSLPMELSGVKLNILAGSQLVEILKKLEKIDSIKIINISENGRKYISNNNFFRYVSISKKEATNPTIAKFTSNYSTQGTYISDELWIELFGK
ncbi:hypothetical protein [Mycoplasma marinum]|uniref:hypothetical protein n=1 Tax=Mycoplasma marinum TaxID=1937190 RepID=UPI0010407504|nr:hypothetical protein [Mycoplasma marinum]